MASMNMIKLDSTMVFNLLFGAVLFFLLEIESRGHSHH